VKCSAILHESLQRGIDTRGGDSDHSRKLRGHQKATSYVLAARGGPVARRHTDGTGVTAMHGGDQMHDRVPVSADPLEIDVGVANGARAHGDLGARLRRSVGSGARS
jgi:hypothetical protein